jgi:hypothetical protein
LDRTDLIEETSKYLDEARSMLSTDRDAVGSLTNMPDSSALRVARDRGGIEPPTRGFSVR